MNESKGFISVGIDMQEVRNILSRLDQDKREKALKDALKQTAEKARSTSSATVFTTSTPASSA